MLVWRRLRRQANVGATAGGGSKPQGPCAHVRPSARCVALADGTACVVRRTIPADNSCCFNAVAYAMHHSKSKAEMLRNTVAREVSSDPETYSEAFLGAPNAAYCQWILQPHNWGGGIELSIMARHYAREIAAWNIETGKQHVFGEESGYTKQVMVVYTGTHYDTLAIAASPRAPEDQDKTEFNPRTKTGKMVVAAAQKLVELSGPRRKGKAATLKGLATGKLKCSECSFQSTDQGAIAAHAKQTGHVKFNEVKA